MLTTTEQFNTGSIKQCAQNRLYFNSRQYTCSLYYERQNQRGKKIAFKLTSTTQLIIGYEKCIIITKRYQVNSGHSLLNSLQPFRFFTYYSVIRTTYLLYTGNMQCSGF